MATPTLRAIRREFHRARITFLAVPNLVDLLSAGDWMDEIVTWPASSRKNRITDFVALAVRLRARRFDLAVLLPNSFRAALMVWMAGARKRVGYDRDGRGMLLTQRLPVRRHRGVIAPHPICDDYAELAVALGCNRPDQTLELFTHPQAEAAVEARLRSHGVDEHSPLVVLAPGAAFGSSKLWPAERFAAVANRLIDTRQAAVVITCGPGEEALARGIGERITASAMVCDKPRLTLHELKALIRRCHLLLGNDTGPRHIAKAFGRPVVTVFGSTHQAWTDTDYLLEQKIQIPVPCGPCQQKACPLGHHECMTGVTVQSVYDACVALLTEPPPPVRRESSGRATLSAANR